MSSICSFCKKNFNCDFDGYCVHCGFCYNPALFQLSYKDDLNLIPLSTSPSNASIQERWLLSENSLKSIWLDQNIRLISERYPAAEIRQWIGPELKSDLDRQVCELKSMASSFAEMKRLTKTAPGGRSWGNPYPFKNIKCFRVWWLKHKSISETELEAALRSLLLMTQNALVEKMRYHESVQKKNLFQNLSAPIYEISAQLEIELTRLKFDWAQIVEEADKTEYPETFVYLKIMSSISPLQILTFFLDKVIFSKKSVSDCFNANRVEGIVHFDALFSGLIRLFESGAREVSRSVLYRLRPRYFTSDGYWDEAMEWRYFLKLMAFKAWQRDGHMGPEETLEAIRYFSTYYDSPLFFINLHRPFHKIPPVHKDFPRFFPHRELIKQHFGSLFIALNKAGVLTVAEGKFGNRCLAKDGHECNSVMEKAIDDLFTQYQIPHEKEPHYPYDPEYNPFSKLRGDWQIGAAIVEYFGLAGNTEYDAKVERKRNLASKHGIKLVEVTHLDLSNPKNLFLKLGFNIATIAA